MVKAAYSSALGGGGLGDLAGPLLGVHRRLVGLLGETGVPARRPLGLAAGAGLLLGGLLEHRPLLLGLLDERRELSLPMRVARSATSWACSSARVRSSKAWRASSACSAAATSAARRASACSEPPRSR